MKEQKIMLIKTIPAVQELRKVPGFNPLKFIRKSRKAEESKPCLELRYKRLWFRLACPNGRLLLNPLRITDQMAIFEAKVFLSREDDLPIASYTATQLAEDVPGGGYVKAAQDTALGVALDNAGFGIQLCDADAGESGEREVSQPAQFLQTRPIDTQPVEESPAKEPEKAPMEEPPTEEEPPASERPRYTEEMTVEEICAVMTPEDASQLVVPIGICKGWTLGQVASDRPASLKWYGYGEKSGNILKAAALTLLGNTQKQAG